MKNIISFLGIYLVLGMLVGCYDDESTTAQLPLPKIMILGDEFLEGGTRVANVGEEYELDCKVNWGSEDSTKFDFRWSYNGEVISNERIGKYTFPETGTVYVTFEVIERATGLTFGTVCTVTVSTKWLLGWLILSEKNGESALDFIHIDTHELYRDVYKMLHPDKTLGSQPYRLAQMCKPSYDHILVMQRGGDGLVELDGRNFSKVIRTEEEFIGEKYPYTGFDPAFYVPAWSSSAYGPEYLVTTKGEVYSRIDKSTSLFNVQQYPTIPLDFPGGAKITSMVFPKQYYNQFMWDDLNKKWRSTYKSSSYDEIMGDIEKGYDETAPENAHILDCFSGLPEGIEFVYGETQNEWHSYCNLITVFKNTNTGRYIFQNAYITMNTSLKTLKAESVEQFELPENIGITDGTQFCLLRGQNTWAQRSPHLFFNVGSKIYFYRQENNKVFLFKDCSLSANAPTGKVVSIHTDPKQRKLGIAFEDGHFYISRFFNEDGDNLINKIAQGNLDPADPSVNEMMEIGHYDGLGKIVHSIFKHGRWGNWSSAEDKNR